MYVTPTYMTFVMGGDGGPGAMNATVEASVFMYNSHFFFGLQSAAAAANIEGMKKRIIIENFIILLVIIYPATLSHKHTVSISS